MMLDIEYLKRGKNVIKGSSELKIMQNNYTPLLDLLVRESIQNSLDARISGASYINVNFKHDSFDLNSLCSKFPVIGERIRKKYINTNNKFIAIMDDNTVGLTGNLAGEYDNNSIDENLGKLVFHIMEEQEREGAGGSWGIGKTLYYRIGNGLVIYYSRVKINNDYQDRLVAAIVEDETNKDGLLSEIEENVGVAWFGKRDNNNPIEAIVDREQIKDFLRIFGLKPMDEKQTGTYVIIPFVNENILLKNNISEKSFNVWWNDNIEDYLYVSCLRWYFPRMCKNYRNGPVLHVYINDEFVQPNEDTLIYKKFNELYDATLDNTINWVKIETIKRKTDLKNDVVGKFAYGLLDKDELGIIKYHLPNPNQFALIDDIESNNPLVFYCRNQGMIINYTSFSKNIANLNIPDNKILVGLFVVDPDNYFTCVDGEIKLDEYLRKGEKSDHSSWEDHSLPNYGRKLHIVEGINNSISKILNEKYSFEKKLEVESFIDIGLARKYGNLFLPESGYGTDSRRVAGKINNSNNLIKSGKNTIKMLGESFLGRNLTLEYDIDIKEKISCIELNNKIYTIASIYNAKEWISNGFEYPCNIKKIALQCLSRYKKTINEKMILVNNDESISFENFNIIFEKICGKCYRILFINNKRQFIPITFRIKIELETNDVLTQTYCDVSFRGD